MNYYIQGSAAKAEQIKAAFEAKGYSDKGFTFDVDDILFFTANNKHINVCPANGWLANIIKTHPDYQELQLPVEPNFKVEDWVVKKDGKTFYGGNYVEQITLIEIDEEGKRIWLSSKTWIDEDEIRLWATSDIKDGDVLVTTKIRNCPFIYRKTSRNNGLAYYYAGVDGDGNFCEGCLKRTLYHFGLVENVVPATKEQRDLLFAKMQEAGYQWDADKKELRKIQHHYDIANFHAGMPVLVRETSLNAWQYVLFSHYYIGGDGLTRFNAGLVGFTQCIPYNDDTKHLLGTTDMCDEQYINW